MRTGWLYVTDAICATRQRVAIVAVFATRVKIRAIDHTKIAVGEPWLKPGAETTVPKTAIEWIADDQGGA
jgi:hypothetical protein